MESDEIFDLISRVGYAQGQSDLRAEILAAIAPFKGSLALSYKEVVHAILDALLHNLNNAELPKLPDA